MVKNLPTIERSTKIRFGKQAPTNQADNTIVLNASSTAINASSGDSIYMAPLRVTNPASTTVIGYNPTTKELYNTNVLTSDIGSGGGGGDITLGTGTTGDYVSTITGGNGITTTGATSGETIAHTLSIDTKTNGGLVIESNQLAVNLGASSITGTLAVGDGGTGATTLTSGKIPYIKADNTFGDSKISYNTATEVTSLSSNLTVTGNLLVQGSATFQHSEIHSVSDPIIEVGNANAIDTIDMGMIMTRPTANVVAGFRGDEKEYTIAFTYSDPSSTDIVPTNASSDGYITANIWGNVLCGNVTTSGSITGSGSGLTSLNADNITSGTLAVSYGGTGATTLDNLITLGSHTTGNYVQSITGGNGITAGAASEGGTPTVAIDAKTNGGLVIESNKLAVDLGASSITGTLAVGDGGTGATTLDNLITLGSHTTGNYVQSISGGNGITAGAASEGGTPTVAIDAKTNGGLVIESNQLAVDLGASSITGTLAVGDGGTNITSYSSGEILYSSGGSLTKLSIGSAGEVLTVAGGNPSWAAASGGASSPWTTSGSDILYNTGEVIIGSYISYDGPIGDVSRFGFPQNHTFTITTNNTERLRIDSSGDVGIGTTNPIYKLDVLGTGRFTSSLTASSFNGSGASLTSLSATNISSGTLAVARGGTNISSYSTGEILYSSAGSLTKLSIGSAGEVLTVAGGIPSWAAASGGGFSGDIADYITHTSDSDTKFGFPSNDTFTITTANSERFRINSSGNVGIGTTNPIYKLDVLGTGRFTSSVTASSFNGSGYSLTTLQAGNISSGTLAVARGGTNISSYITGDIIYANGPTSLTTLGIGSAGEVLTVAGGSPSWATASGGGGGGATAGTTSVSHFSNEISVSVSGGPYDYMYNETSYSVGSTSSTFDTLNISTAMTQGQKLVLKLHTSAISIEGQIARGSSLSVIINGTTHTVFSNFQDHTIHIPYDNNATAVSFLILEITKENTNQVTIEAKLSAADFTKTREFSPDFLYNGINTNNRDSAIHNVAYTSSASFSGSTFRLKLGYLGVGHSHDFYFTQGDPSSPTFQASQIEFYYNNSFSSWSQASQTNVYTNFDKSVGMTLTYNKEYRMHHEVLRASTADYPYTILFTVEEMNAASGGGGGGGGYATGDFNTNITTSMGMPPYYFNGIDISSSFSPTNYNFNSTVYTSMPSNFEKINLDHTLPTSLPYEYHFYFTNAFGSVDKNSPSAFKVMTMGTDRDTFNIFPDPNAQTFYFQSTPNYRYELVIKARDTSGNEWTAEWFEFYKY
jgi:hypothetical protein